MSMKMEDFMNSCNNGLLSLAKSLYSRDIDIHMNNDALMVNACISEKKEIMLWLKDVACMNGKPYNFDIVIGQLLNMGNEGIVLKTLNWLDGIETESSDGDDSSEQGIIEMPKPIVTLATIMSVMNMCNVTNPSIDEDMIYPSGKIMDAAGDFVPSGNIVLKNDNDVLCDDNVVLKSSNDDLCDNNVVSKSENDENCSECDNDLASLRSESESAESDAEIAHKNGLMIIINKIKDKINMNPDKYCYNYRLRERQIKVFNEIRYLLEKDGYEVSLFVKNEKKVFVHIEW